MSKHSFEIMEILYRALHSDHGVLVKTNKLEYFRSLCYKEIKNDPALAGLKITRSRTNPETELCIIKKADHES